MANIVEYFGKSSGSRNCGYCKTSSPSDYTHGMWAHTLSPQSYQTLIDRNWRRSGKYCYKPMNDHLCCPMYTIRCDPLNFKLRKSHKKVIKNFNNFIKFDSKTSRASKNNSNDANLDEFKDRLNEMQSSVGNFDNIKLGSGDKVLSNLQSTHKSSTSATSKQLDSTKDVNTTSNSNAIIGDLAKKQKVNKKKYLRRQKLIQKHMKRQNCSENEAKQILYERSCKKQKEKSLEDFLSECENYPNAKHVFKKKFVPVSSNSTKSAYEAQYNVFREYQMNIHKEGEEKVSFSGFKQFLIDSPIQYRPNGIAPQTDSDLVRYYGSFHQHYYINDRLVAVAVLDILPNCISSVYLFYDPEYSFLNLGVYSALTEIALVRKYSKFLPDLKYYYMGFYIHSCPKMLYKGQFLPSDLLCSETFRWYNIESCLIKLAKQKYSRFCDDPKTEDKDGKVEDSEIMLYHDEEAISLVNYRSKHSLRRQALSTVREYANLVGKRCAPNLLYYLS